jgi:hypothetical protein
VAVRYCPRIAGGSCRFSGARRRAQSIDRTDERLAGLPTGLLPEHPNLLIGPLRKDQYEYLKSLTFNVNPDQLGALVLGAQYQSAPGDLPPVIIPFGMGCMQLAELFEDLNVAQAIVGALDATIRRFFPPDILAFTATRPMFERLCTLGEQSLLPKPFWDDLQKAREKMALMGLAQ